MMNEIALKRTASPAILLWLVWLALLPAIAVALTGTARLFDASRECQGAFSSDFSRDFDVHRCKLTIKAIGADFKFSVPFP
jgi:hypothetical protein